MHRLPPHLQNCLIAGLGQVDHFGRYAPRYVVYNADGGHGATLGKRGCKKTLRVIAPIIGLKINTGAGGRRNRFDRLYGR